MSFRTASDRAVVVLFALVAVGTAAEPAQTPKAVHAPQPGQQTAIEVEASTAVACRYHLYLPPQYDGQDRWPLLLFLHGSGERGNDLELVKVHGPPKLIAAGKEFPFIVVSPQCPRFQRWETAQLAALLDQVERTCKVDPDRVYVTGLSLGGFGTWQLAANYPDRFAAIAPICGGGEKEAAAVISQVPVWAFHGAQDKAVPLKASEEMIAALRQAGAEPKLTVYPDAGHDSWTATYDNPELYDWLLSHRRRPKSNTPAGNASRS